MTGRTLDTDLTTHRLTQYADRMQSDAAASDVVLVLCGTEKWFEDVLLILQGNAGAMVFNNQLQMTSLVTADQGDDLISRTVFDCIVNQSRKNNFQGGTIQIDEFLD